jgi:hypothetical protein
MATNFVDGRALFLKKNKKKLLVGWGEHYQFCWWERVLCQQMEQFLSVGETIMLAKKKNNCWLGTALCLHRNTNFESWENTIYAKKHKCLMTN